MNYVIFGIIVVSLTIIVLFYFNYKKHKENSKENVLINAQQSFISEDIIKLYGTVGIVLLIAYLYYEYYLSNGIESKVKFQTFLTFISTVFAVIFSSALLLQTINFNTNQKNEIIKNYSNLSQEFFDYLIELFMKNPDMIYLYNDLFDIKHIDANTKNRNYIKEHQIMSLVFSKMGKFAVYIEKSTNKESVEWLEKFQGKIFKTFMKSPTLRNYWTNTFKNNFAGPASKRYIEYHFKL